MKSRITKRGNASNTSLEKSDRPDQSETEKQQLKNQINELQTLISQIETNLSVNKFGNADEKTRNVLPLALDRWSSKRALDTNALFRKELHRYIGFYCQKMTSTEYIFNYKPYDKIDRNKTYWVQIHNNDGKTLLGHWGMPIGVDIDKILFETPVNKLSMVIPFLKNWKLHIDCYSERKSQFQELKDFTSELTNCTVEANAPVTWITLQLFGVCNKSKDSYVDIVVYLAYKQNETRPCKITTEWNSKQCSSTDETDLKAYTKLLKNERLLDGFQLMIEANHPVFSWTTEEQDNSPLELNNTSDSEEESSLDRVKLNRKKVMKKRKNLRESKKRSEQTKSKSKSKKTQPRVSVEDNESYSPHVNRSSTPTTGDNTSKSPPLSRNKSLHPETERSSNESALEPVRKLRQTTLTFRSSRTLNANPEKTQIAVAQKISHSTPEPAIKSKKKFLPAKKRAPLVGILSAKKKAPKNVNRAITSTPVHNKISNRVKFVPMNDAEISPIVSADEKNKK